MGKWKQVQKYAEHIPSPLENAHKHVSSVASILILDATWVRILKRDKAIVIAYDTEIGAVDYLIRNKESKHAYKTIFQRLTKIGYKPICIVSDGNAALESVAKEYKFPHQRCVVHLLRDLERVLGKRVGKKLKGMNKRIYDQMRDIWFTKKIEDIPEKIIKLDKFKKKKWIIRWVKKTLPNAILHLSYKENVPHTTNILENLNGQIKQRIKTMRGMKSKESLHNFLKILFYFRKYK